MFIYGFLYENVRGDLIFNLMMNSRRFLDSNSVTDQIWDKFICNISLNNNNNNNNDRRCGHHLRYSRHKRPSLGASNEVGPLLIHEEKLTETIDCS
jgi:hypothetical protein